MFLISDSPPRCRRAALKLHAAVASLNPGPLHEQVLPGSTLCWFSVRPGDNLHVFDDGFVVGKLDFSEATRLEPIVHEGDLPSSYHPLLGSIIVRTAGRRIVVEPTGIGSAYYSGGTVSDMQLAVADALDLEPAPESLAVLATVGYFPGTLTFFDPVKRIDLFCSYDATAQRLLRNGEFEPARPDDERLLERLLEIIPRGVGHQLGISGGGDSRCILGLLLKSDMRPSLFHLEGPERGIAERLARSLDLPLLVTSGDPTLPAGIYTILTDGQIYYKGGLYSRLRNHVRSDAVYHLGLFSGPLFKNAYGSSWKLPGRRSGAPDRLIGRGLLSRAPDAVRGLRTSREKEQIRDLLRQNLAPSFPLLRDLGAKAAANWFFYLNRGVRWAQANVADLNYYTPVVFVLSDTEALRYGLTSNAWQNLRNERLIRINRALFPALEVPYSSGRGPEYRGGPAAALAKVKHAYVDRFAVYLRGNRKYRARSAAFQGSGHDVESSIDLSQYFTEPVDHIVTNPSFGVALRRAAITLYHVVRHLRSDAPALDSLGRAAASEGSPQTASSRGAEGLHGRTGPVEATSRQRLP